MNLNAAAGIIDSRENKAKTENYVPQPHMEMKQQQLPMSMVGTKMGPNVSGQQYDMMRNQASKCAGDRTQPLS